MRAILMFAVVAIFLSTPASAADYGARYATDGELDIRTVGYGWQCEMERANCYQSCASRPIPELCEGHCEVAYEICQETHGSPLMDWLKSLVPKGPKA